MYVYIGIKTESHILSYEVILSVFVKNIVRFFFLALSSIKLGVSSVAQQ